MTVYRHYYSPHQVISFYVLISCEVVVKVGVDGVQRHTGSAVTERVEQAVGPDLVSDSTKAEDGHLEVACVVEEEVLGLEAMVEDTTGVAVADGKDHWEVLREAAPGDFGEELATLGELHDNLDLGTGGEDLDQGDDEGIHTKLMECSAFEFSSLIHITYPLLKKLRNTLKQKAYNNA
ncbi:hypothetical protein NL676_017945 [Syzygium grande]|nr:hypothetical protein NL676_017945 [Syzygium grande]